MTGSNQEGEKNMATDHTDAANARIFGSDYDTIYLAPLGTTLPTTIDGALDSAFEAVGWLSDDGISESQTGDKTQLRGYQGGRIIRTIMENPGSTYTFVALESKAQTQSLRYNETSVTTADGVRHAKRKAGQKVQPRVAVVDVFDEGDDSIQERWVFEQWDITASDDRVFVSNDIAGFPCEAEVIGDWDSYMSLNGAATGWSIEVTGAPTGGTYALTVNGYATAGIAYGASAANVAAALNALSGVTGLTGITATGTDTIAITFPSKVNLTGDGSALTGGTTPGLTVTKS